MPHQTEFFFQLETHLKKTGNDRMIHYMQKKSEIKIPSKHQLSQ